MDITKLNHIHFTGIKGVGMTALALCALDLGITVTGSDVEEEFLTDETLLRRGLAWKTGFSKENLDPRPDLVVTTGAHGGLNNPEVQAARELNIPVMSHAEALAEFTKGKKVIAVAGVGGKTTTCAMIATILNELGMHPSFAIGVADIPSLGTPGRYDKDGQYFVVEADEYAISPGVDNRPRFSLLNPYILVLTNIEHDHPDIYPTLQDNLKAFQGLVNKSQYVIYNNDNNNILKLDIKGIAYGLPKNINTDAEIRAINYEEQRTSFALKVIDYTQAIDLGVPGEFNIYNAAASFSAIRWLGKKDGEFDYDNDLPNATNSIDTNLIAAALAKYTGCKRRFEKIAEINNILLYDDYAHHPSEVAATLKAAREWFPDRRIWVYFQPHTYSRTKSLLKEFGESFNDADFVGIDGIFSSAREAKDDSISSQMLVDEIKKHHKNPENVNYTTQEEAIETLAKNLKPGDVLLTMGAGDIYKIHKILIERMSR